MSFNSVYDLKAFYAGRKGRLIRRLVQGHLRTLWPDTAGLSLAGLGYAAPYLRAFQDKSGRTMAVMPPAMGVHAWPSAKPNQTCLASDSSLPFATESLDRVIMIHSLELSKEPDALLQEVFRVLRSSGRLLLVVPNRLGFWARADWTPFGYGRPYTVGQVRQQLKQHNFVPEAVERALYMPPFRSMIMLRAAYSVEGVGAFIFPALAGLYIIDAVKEVYAPTGLLKTEAARKTGKVMGDAVPSG